jgi:hypothetical protein
MMVRKVGGSGARLDACAVTFNFSFFPLYFASAIIELWDMKPHNFRPTQKPKLQPLITTTEISPDDFKTLWGSRFEQYKSGLKKTLANIDQERQLKQDRFAHLKDLRSKGLTLSEIGELVGLTRERVRQLLKTPPTEQRSTRGPKPKILRKDDRFYFLWRGIISRTKNKKDKYYGGRGIRICKRWMTYANFEKDMWVSYQEHVRKHGEFNTTIDRINNDGDYNPSNCRWADKFTQGRNKRHFRGVGAPSY